MKIALIGTGYVGLVTALCFAEMGHNVTCVDIDLQKIDSLAQGIPTFYEPGLDSLLETNLKQKRISFTSDYEKALEDAEFCFLALPTNKKEDGSANLDPLFSAIESLGKYLTQPLIVVTKSTSPVGTADHLQQMLNDTLKKRKITGKIDIVASPEFLKEGSAIADCMKPNRIIIGSCNTHSIEQMKKLYKPFSLNHDRFLVMDPRSAEMTKYAANIMLASRISLMNDLALLCEEVNANIHDVRVGIGSDERIGYQFLYAGIGFGGSCFPKDLEAAQWLAHQSNLEMPMLSAIIKVNERQKTILFHKINRYFKGQVEGKTIAVWGLSFKPETDDIREAPSLILISQLLAAGAKVHLFDPIAMKNVQKIFPSSSHVVYFSSEYEATKQSDAIALVTEWKQFRFVNHKVLLKSMRGKAFFDGRNQYLADEMKALGYDYFGIGVPRGNTITPDRTIYPTNHNASILDFASCSGTVKDPL